MYNCQDCFYECNQMKYMQKQFRSRLKQTKDLYKKYEQALKIIKDDPNNIQARIFVGLLLIFYPQLRRNQQEITWRKNFDSCLSDLIRISEQDDELNLQQREKIWFIYVHRFKMISSSFDFHEKCLNKSIELYRRQGDKYRSRIIDLYIRLSWLTLNKLKKIEYLKNALQLNQGDTLLQVGIMMLRLYSEDAKMQQKGVEMFNNIKISSQYSIIHGIHQQLLFRSKNYHQVIYINNKQTVPIQKLFGSVNLNREFTLVCLERLNQKMRQRRLTESYLQLGNIKKAIEVNPQQTKTNNSIISEANSYYQHQLDRSFKDKIKITRGKSKQQSQQYFLTAYRQNNTDYRSILLLIKYYQSIGQFAQALRYYQKLLQVWNTNIPILLRIIELEKQLFIQIGITKEILSKFKKMNQMFQMEKSWKERKYNDVNIYINGKRIMSSHECVVKIVQEISSLVNQDQAKNIATTYLSHCYFYMENEMPLRINDQDFQKSLKLCRQIQKWCRSCNLWYLLQFSIYLQKEDYKNFNYLFEKCLAQINQIDRGILEKMKYLNREIREICPQFGLVIKYKLQLGGYQDIIRRVPHIQIILKLMEANFQLSNQLLRYLFFNNSRHITIVANHIFQFDQFRLPPSSLEKFYILKLMAKFFGKFSITNDIIQNWKIQITTNIILWPNLIMYYPYPKMLPSTLQSLAQLTENDSLKKLIQQYIWHYQGKQSSLLFTLKKTNFFSNSLFDEFKNAIKASNSSISTSFLEIIYLACFKNLKFHSTYQQQANGQIKIGKATVYLDPSQYFDNNQYATVNINNQIGIPFKIEKNGQFIWHSPFEFYGRNLNKMYITPVTDYNEDWNYLLTNCNQLLPISNQQKLRNTFANTFFDWIKRKPGQIVDTKFISRNCLDQSRLLHLLMQFRQYYDKESDPRIQKIKGYLEKLIKDKQFNFLKEFFKKKIGLQNKEMSQTEEHEKEQSSINQQSQSTQKNCFDENLKTLVGSLKIQFKLHSNQQNYQNLVKKCLEAFNTKSLEDIKIKSNDAFSKISSNPQFQPSLLWILFLNSYRAVQGFSTKTTQNETLKHINKIMSVALDYYHDSQDSNWLKYHNPKMKIFQEIGKLIQFENLKGNLKKVQSLFKDLLRGLLEFNQCDIMHLDIAYRNLIMIKNKKNQDEVCKFIDFDKSFRINDTLIMVYLLILFFNDGYKEPLGQDFIGLFTKKAHLHPKAKQQNSKSAFVQQLNRSQFIADQLLQQIKECVKKLVQSKSFNSLKDQFIKMLKRQPKCLHQADSMMKDFENLKEYIKFKEKLVEYRTSIHYLQYVQLVSEYWFHVKDDEQKYYYLDSIEKAINNFLSQKPPSYLKEINKLRQTIQKQKQKNQT